MSIVAQCAKCNLFFNLKKHSKNCPHCNNYVGPEIEPEPPTKVCPACHAVAYNAKKTCDGCGYEFVGKWESE